MAESRGDLIVTPDTCSLHTCVLVFLCSCVLKKSVSISEICGLIFFVYFVVEIRQKIM